MSGSGALACHSSRVVVRDLVLHYSAACAEHSQVRHGAARVERGHHALWHCSVWACMGREIGRLWSRLDFPGVERMNQGTVDLEDKPRTIIPMRFLG